VARLIYLLDTNVISDYLNQVFDLERFNRAIAAGDRVCLCHPVYYESLRGLLKAKSTRKLDVFHSRLIPMLEWVEMRSSDWEQAARLWADAVSRGKQLSDVDLLIASIALRQNAIIVSSDADFDAFPIKRES
jgi:predicted nucleic acid-binding protein